MSAGDDGQERPERIATDADPIIGHGLEVVAQGFQCGRRLGGAGGGFGGDVGQRGKEVFGLQTAAGVLDQFAAEQTLGFGHGARRSRGRGGPNSVQPLAV